MERRNSSGAQQHQVCANSPTKEHQFLTSGPIKKTSHFFATATSFRLCNYEDLPAEKRPGEKFRKVISGSLYRSNGKLIKHAEMTYQYGSKYICTGNEDILNTKEYPGMIHATFSPDIDIIRGKTLYLGNWMGQYGHFIIENLSRLWDLDKLKHYKNFAAHPFVFDKGLVKIHPYQSYLLDLLGVDHQKIVPLYQHTKLLSVDVPEQAWVIAGPVHSKAKAIYTRVHQAHNNKKRYQKIFLSRLEEKSSRIKNIREVESFFKKNQYEVLYPEKLTIKEQLEIYANCQVMAAFSGSGLHNSVFSPPEALIIELGDPRSPNRALKMQIAAIELMGQEHRFIPYSGTPEGIYNINYLPDLGLRW